MESVQPEAPRMESVQPETPRMESFQSPQSPAENAQGPWQGGYGDTRDTASPPKKNGERYVHCFPGDGNSFPGLLLLWLCGNRPGSLGYYFCFIIQAG